MNKLSLRKKVKIYSSVMKQQNTRHCPNGTFPPSESHVATASWSAAPFYPTGDAVCHTIAELLPKENLPRANTCPGHPYIEYFTAFSFNAFIRTLIQYR